MKSEFGAGVLIATRAPVTGTLLIGLLSLLIALSQQSLRAYESEIIAGVRTLK
jgi:hypothetical protein